MEKNWRPEHLPNDCGICGRAMTESDPENVCQGCIIERMEFLGRERKRALDYVKGRRNWLN